MATREKTFSVGLDRIIIGQSEELTDKPFFNKIDKDKQYRTLELPMDKNRGLTGTHLLAEHNVSLTLEAGDDALERQKYMEENSYIKLVNEDLNYPLIPLSELLPYRIIKAGATFQVVPKTSGANVFEGFPLGAIDPLLLDGEQKIAFEFIPAKGLTSAAAGYKLPKSKATNEATNKGFYFGFRLLGLIDRPISKQ